MLTDEQNELLTRVGPGTPMGELMRRYWVPALLSWEIPEPDCPPVTIKLLAEELVAFRDTSGKPGVVGARCAHRRAHLFWGRNEENGLRCVYHGWKYDCEGKCIDMPSEPAESNFKDKVRIPAYPTYEVGGVVWAYMGPPEKKPAPPLFAWTQVPPENRSMSKVWQQCNWLQALEGGIDTAHVGFLHSGRPPGLRADDSTVAGRSRNISLAPTVEVVPTDYGFSYAGIRTLGEEGNYVRAYHWIMPWHSYLPGGGGNGGHMWVPMDDENTMVYNRSAIFNDPPEERGRIGAAGAAFGFGGAPAGAQGGARAGAVAGEGGFGGPAEYVPGESPIWLRDARRPQGFGNGFNQDIDPATFRSYRNAENKYKIDRYVQKTQTFSGIEGGNCQDRAIQESMGGIADRTLERLGTTDRAIITARRMLMKAAQTVQDGGDPPGIAPTYYKLRAYETVLPSEAYWFEELKQKLFERGPGVTTTS